MALLPPDCWCILGESSDFGGKAKKGLFTSVVILSVRLSRIPTSGGSSIVKLLERSKKPGQSVKYDDSIRRKLEAEGFHTDPSHAPRNFILIG